MNMTDTTRIPQAQKQRCNITLWSVWILRVVVGVVFITSGVAKDIDLWGFVFKIEEYLGVWTLHVPRSLVVSFSFLLSATEFLCGVFLLFGCYRRSSVWLMAAMMAFMLPLSFYIMVANPVSDCGCFGDFLHISNTATFIKNIILSAAIIYLIPRNGRYDGLFRPGLQWVVVVLCGLYVLSVGWIGYNVQPMVDFRSFPQGTFLTPPDGEESEDADVRFEFIYSKDGEERAFSAEELPDSTWTFVDRRVVSGQEASSLTELTVYDSEGADVTADVFPEEREQMTIVLPQYSRADASYTYTVNELQHLMERRGGRLIEIAAIPEDKIADWADISMASYPIYIADETTLKEFSRGTMSVVYTIDGRVQWKRTLWSVPPTILNLPGSDTAEVIESLRPWSSDNFIRMSLVLATVLLLLAAADRAAVLRHIIRRNSRRNKKADAEIKEKNQQSENNN
ncbi:MAG: DoxX family protein [Paramuribaculum sp.]